MEDNDITRGSGRGAGISINKVKGNKGGKHKTTLLHSSRLQAPRPADTQQSLSTKQPTHHPISQTHTNFPPFLSTSSPQMSTVHAPTSQIPTNTQQPHSTMKPTHHLTSKAPSNIQQSLSTKQPTHHLISQTHTNFPPFLSTSSPQMSTVHAPTSQIPTNTQQPHSTMKPTHHLTSKTPSNIQKSLFTKQPTHHPISQTHTNFPPFLSTSSPQMSTVHAPTSQIPTNTQQPHSTRKPTHHLTSNTPSNIQLPQPTRQPKHHPISQTFTNFPPLLSTPSPQMSTIHAPTSQIPTNIQSPHSTPSPPHLSNTHRPYDVVSGGDPHASSSSCDDSYPIAGSTDPTDRRIWIRPGPQLTFEPAVKPPRDITKIMKRLFQGTWATYGELMKKDTALADLWYNEFQRIYKWLPEHDQDIKKTYHHKASDGYQNTMYRVRRGMDKGEWIPALLREKLEQNWEDNKWKDKAAVNKRNRRSSNGPLHTCGSIPTIEHSKRLKTDSNMTPSCWEVYLKTHKMKGDPSKWVSSKSQMVADEYERRIFERNSQQTEGDDVSNDHQSDNFIFLDVVGGVDKKGRIYGLGTEAGKYKPSSSRSSDGISPSEYEHMRTAISKMSAENMELKERLKTNEELIRASQEESRLAREQAQQSQEDSRLLREQFQKLIESFTQGHSHLPPYQPHRSS